MRNTQELPDVRLRGPIHHSHVNNATATGNVASSSGNAGRKRTNNEDDDESVIDDEEVMNEGRRKSLRKNKQNYNGEDLEDLLDCTEEVLPIGANH